MGHIEPGRKAGGPQKAAVISAGLLCLSALSISPAIAAESCTKDLIRLPLKENVYEYFPRRAFERGVSGRSVMRCGVTPEGGLTGCVVIEETPKNQGFGEALLSLAPKFHVRAADARPICADATVTIPINWRLR